MEWKRVQCVLWMLAAAAVCSTTANAKSAMTQAATARSAAARQSASEANLPETDLGASFYRTFTQSTKGNTTLQTPSNGNGAMVELRHIQKPLLGYEVSYAFNQANQGYAPNPGACGYACFNKPETITANASQVGLDWIASMQRGNFSPFAVGGMGFFIAVPTQNDPELNTVVRIMYTYGAGLDFGLFQHAGVRVQYRGNLYKAPDLDETFAATDKFTQTGEAMVGFYFHL